MENKVVKAIIAIILIVTLTIADFLVLTVNAVTYAIEVISTTNNNNVEFLAYFVTEEGEKVTKQDAKMNVEDLKLKLEVSVNNEGYFNGKVTLKESNFKLKSDSYSDGISKIEGNTIYLNQVIAGETIVAEIGIEPIKQEDYSLEMLDMESRLLLEGEYASKERKDIDIKAERRVELKLENPYEEQNAQLSSQIVTNKVYKIGEEEKRIVQLLITSALNGNGYPIKDTTIEVEVPNEVEEVKVTSRGTKATNANSVDIEEADYKLEGNKLIITIANNEKDEKIKWSQTGEDKILVTYIINQEKQEQAAAIQAQAAAQVTAAGKTATAQAAAQATAAEKTATAQTIAGQMSTQAAAQTAAQTQATAEQVYSEQKNKIKSKITLYDEESTIYRAEAEYQIKEEIDGIVEIKGIEEAEPIYKGNMYLGEETEIKKADKLDIRYENISQDIEIQDANAKLIEKQIKNVYGEEKEEEIEQEVETTYKATAFKKEEIDKVLGDKGSITIKGENDVTLAVINKTLQANEQGMIEAKYVGEVKKIIIEIENAEHEGEISIEHTMALKLKEYTREQIKNIKALKIETQIKYNENEKTVNRIMPIADTTTVANIISESKVLTTLQTNNNVVFNVILKTDNIKYDLYKNPTIEVELPKELSNIQINSINQLYGEEVKIETARMMTNEEGNKVIAIKFNGEQTKYTNSVSEGIILSFNTNMTFNKLTPSKETKIVLKYTNENGDKDEYYTELPLKLQSKYGIMAYSKIEEFENTGKVIELTNNEQDIAEIEAKAEKIAKMQMAIVNNFGAEVENVAIIGNIPVGEGVVASFASEILATNPGVKIYYSPNQTQSAEDATWTEEKTNIANMKSYKIVIPKIAAQEVMQFEYGLKIGVETDYNKTGVVQNIVTYKYDGKDRFAKTELEIHSKEETVVQMDEQNNGNGTSGNTQAGNNSGEGNTPNNTQAGEGNTSGNTQAGEGSTPNNVGETKPQEGVTKQELTVNTVVTKGGEKVTSKDIIHEGEKLWIEATITNNLGRDLQNVRIVSENKNAVMYEAVAREVDDYTTLDEAGNPQKRTIEYIEETEAETKEFAKIEKLAQGESRTLKYQISAKEDENILSAKLKIAADNMEEKITDITTNKIEQAELKVTAKYSYHEDLIIATGTTWATNIVVENVSSGPIEDAIIQIKLSENLQCTGEGWVNYDEMNLEFIDFSNNILTYKIKKIEKGEKEVIELIPIILNTHTSDEYEHVSELATVTTQKNKYVSNLLEREAIKNEEIAYPTKENSIEDDVEIIVVEPEGRKNEYISLKEEDTNTDIITVSPETDETKSISAVINEAKETIEEQTEVEDIYAENYKIAGTVWFDENNNGMKESNETLLQGRKVKILNEKTGEFVKNENDKDMVLVTDSEGHYEVELPQGRYIVYFEYDSENYDVTTYQKNGIVESKKSNVLSKEIEVDGQKQAVGITDTIELSNKDESYINMGIKKKNTFDLSLEKKISKVTVQNEEGTKTYEYNDGISLAKAEINPDYYTGTVVIVEYVLKITNEGDIAGYVNDIVDYLPEAFKFNSELNNDWYLSEDGKLHNISLENEKIEEGETKEVKLILTKTLENDEETGRFANVAEIGRSSNEEGLDDIDSIANNKKTDEDDISTASIIISVTTGRALQYVTIVLIVMSVIAIVVYVISKKIIKIDEE